MNLLNPKEVEKIIDKYDGIVIRSRFQLDKEFIDKASNLKFIARAGSSLENIDVNYAKQKHIKCINAGEKKQAVAEHALGMILNLTNKINTANNQLKNLIGLEKKIENRIIRQNILYNWIWKY